MRLRDPALWREQKAELLRDHEHGPGFAGFVESWCTRAEALLDTEPLVGHHLRPLDALRRTLNDAEAEFGVLPAGWTAQMLLVIAANWVHGGAGLFEAMTVFEKKMCADLASAVDIEVTDDDQ